MRVEEAIDVAPEATPTVDVTPKSDPADSNWQVLGQITIDTGTLLLIDPVHNGADVGELVGADFAQVPIPGGDFSAVVVGTGMGDGRMRLKGAMSHARSAAHCRDPGAVP